MISPVDSSVDLDALGLSIPDAIEKEELGREEFLQLMLTQLENQDPFKPMESGEFLGQLAQFGTVTGIGELQGSIDSLATSLVSDQALQAASLVGRSVVVESGTTFFSGESLVEGAVDLPVSSSNIQLNISDAAGQLVRQITLGSNPEGQVPFYWGGETDLGVIAPPGLYNVSAQYFDGTDMLNAPTLVKAEVDSVTVGANGLSIQLRGLGPVPFSAVKEIGNQVTRPEPVVPAVNPLPTDSES